MNIPIIRLEIQGMRTTVQAALTEHAALIDEQVQLAVDRALHPDAVQAVVDETVQRCVKEAISDEIRAVFRYNGAGRAAIRETIKQWADEHYGERKP